MILQNLNLYMMIIIILYNDNNDDNSNDKRNKINLQNISKICNLYLKLNISSF